MKKDSPARKSDEMRKSYARQDLGTLKRGMFFNKVTRSANVVILENSVAKIFPNSRAVNAALKSLLVEKHPKAKKSRRSAV